MNRQRLLKLADLLEADAKNDKGIKFDLSDWGDAGGNAVSHSCGTTACAVGLAVVSGAFKMEGLHNAAEKEDPNFIDPGFNDLLGWRAVMAFFEIDRSDAEFLFLQSNYIGEPTLGAAGELCVARRIRDFVGKVAADTP